MKTTIKVIKQKDIWGDEKEYVVIERTKYFTKPIKSFKTKYQALKFAKAYMKNH